jgi:hypothetical protein
MRWGGQCKTGDFFVEGGNGGIILNDSRLFFFVEGGNEGIM